MTCSDLPFHDAANIFPMHGTEKFEKLVESIQAGGFDQMKPIVTYHGEIVDGRNRYLAAKKAGKTPIIKARDDVNPYLYAWQSNGLSHDLTTDQRYLCWEKCKEGSGEWLATQEAAKAAANRARSEAAKGNKNAAKDRPENSSSTTSATTVRKGHEKGATAKAKASKTNRGTVQRCGWLEKHRPDLFELVEAP